MHHSRNQTAPDGRDEGEEADTDYDRLPNCNQRRMGVQHDQWVGAGGWMDGLGREHEHECQDERQNVDPKRIPKQLKTKNADERTAHVAAEQRARLSCGRAREAK